MPNKSAKRILSVKLLHEQDESPDTSYLGEHSDKATSEYSIDRKHSLDCQINSHANDETIEKLKRAMSYVLEVTAQSLTSEQDDACEILETAMEQLAACDCDERGDQLSDREYRYFNPSSNYITKDGKPEEGINRRK